MTLLIAFDSVSTSTSLTTFPLFGVPEIDVFVAFWADFFILFRYSCNALPYLSFDLLTNDLIVVSNSCLICTAKAFSSFNSDANNIDSKYSNALPLPVTPTFVNVDAGSKLLSASSAFAFVAALYILTADFIIESEDSVEAVEKAILDRLGKSDIKWDYLGEMNDPKINRITYEEVIDDTRPIQSKKVLGVEV